MERNLSPQSQEKVNLEKLGGLEGVRLWVDRFYDKVRGEPLLAGMFPSDLSESRNKQHAFFVEFFDGPKLYTENYGRPFMRFKHRHFKIGKPERDAWMRLVMEALVEALQEQGLNAEGVIEAAEAKLGAIADVMVNHDPGKKDPYYFN